MLRSGLIFLLGTTLAAVPAAAEVFQYRDAEGHIYLTDKPMHGNVLLVKRYKYIESRSRSRATSSELKRRHHELASLVEEAAETAGLDPHLVQAVILVESAYDVRALSKAGAAGLMQLMQPTAEAYGVSDRFDPEQNLRGGTAYLRDLLNTYSDDLELALAAYNAGETAVAKYNYSIPPYAETQQYVRKVLDLYGDGSSSPLNRF